MNKYGVGMREGTYSSLAMSRLNSFCSADLDRAGFLIREPFKHLVID